MTTNEIAKKLVTLCRSGDFDTAQKTLFAENAVSIEPEKIEGFDKETKGLQHILEKNEKFSGMIEKVHSVTTSEPLVIGNAIAFTFDMDVTIKGQKRNNLKELCVYEVKEGKIVSERFFT